MPNSIKIILLAMGLLALACDNEPGEPKGTTSGITTVTPVTTGAESSTGESSSTGEILVPSGECGLCPKGLMCTKVRHNGYIGHICSRGCWGVGTCDDLAMVCRHEYTAGQWCVDTCTFDAQCPADQTCTGDDKELGVCIQVTPAW